MPITRSNGRASDRHASQSNSWHFQSRDMTLDVFFKASFLSLTHSLLAFFWGTGSFTVPSLLSSWHCLLLQGRFLQIETVPLGRRVVSQETQTDTMFLGKPKHTRFMSVPPRVWSSKQLMGKKTDQSSCWGAVFGHGAWSASHVVRSRDAVFLSHFTGVGFESHLLL